METAAAAFLGPNGILGLFRIGAALGQRNRVYSEAGATAQEINAYYDGLIARAQGVRKDFIAEARTGTRSAQFALRTRGSRPHWRRSAELPSK